MPQSTQKVGKTKIIMKKSFKKIACLMAACMTVALFSGCSLDFIEKVEPTAGSKDVVAAEEAGDTTANESNEIIDPSGGMVGSKYINEMLGMQFVPGDGWDYASDEGILGDGLGEDETGDVSGEGADTTGGVAGESADATGEATDNSYAVTDPGLVMYAMDTAGNSASVLIQYVGDTSDITGEDFAAEAKTQMEQSFTDVGSSLEVTTGKAEFIGKECACNDVVLTSDGTTVYEKLIYLVEGDYVATIFITVQDSALIEDVAYMFSAI